MSALEKCSHHSAPIILTTFGSAHTIRGVSNIGEGHALEGARQALLGLTATNFGNRWMGLDCGMNQELMRYSICAGTGSVALKGIGHLAKGIGQRNARQILKGTLQTAGGIAGAIYLDALDSRVIRIAHESLLLAGCGYHISKSALSDLRKGDYRKGAGKILLGAGAIVCAGYYFYNQMGYMGYNKVFYPNDPLTYEQQDFISRHDSEISDIYTTQKTPDGWTKLGNGVSKAAYSHPDAPGVLIKIPTRATPYRSDTDNDVLTHHRHLQKAKEIAFDFPSIRVPSSSLVETPNGPIVVEERFNFENYYSVSHPRKQEAVEEFDHFVKKSKLCDVLLQRDHNAAFLKGSDKDPKIGVFDFDCNTDSIFKIGSNLKIKKTSARIITAAGTILTATAAITKALTGPKLAKAVITAGIATGTLAGILTYINHPPYGIILPDGVMHAPEETLAVAGAVTVLGGLVIPVATSIYKGGKYGLRKLSNAYSYAKSFFRPTTARAPEAQVTTT